MRQLLAPVQWAMNSTYHTTLQATSTQLAFHVDMIMLTNANKFHGTLAIICQLLERRCQSLG